jgi:hypothetical protein
MWEQRGISQSRTMKSKTSPTKLLYTPPRLTVVGSVAGLTARVTDLTSDQVDSARFSFDCDEPGSRSLQLVLH